MQIQEKTCKTNYMTICMSCLRLHIFGVVINQDMVTLREIPKSEILPVYEKYGEGKIS